MQMEIQCSDAPLSQLKVRCAKTIARHLRASHRNFQIAGQLLAVEKIN
jgi:hypothetical protein